MQTSFAVRWIWRNHGVRTYTPVGVCGPAIRQGNSPAFYQSLNQPRRTLIGV